MTGIDPASPDAPPAWDTPSARYPLEPVAPRRRATGITIDARQRAMADSMELD